MKKGFIFLGIIAIMVIVGVLAYKNLSKKEIKEISTPMTKESLTGKNVAMIIAFKDFRDEEYFVPKGILEAAGAEIKTASSQKGTAIGADGGEVEVNLLVSEINPADFDAVIFIGGPGTLKYLDNEDSYKVVQETVSQEKVLAAICIAPVILAKAGVLGGKKATVWSSPLDKSAVKILEENGAIFQDELIVVDGKLITGNGPTAAKEFGETLVETLSQYSDFIENPRQSRD